MRAGAASGGAVEVAACARGAGVVVQNEVKWAREAYCLEGARGAAVRAAGCWRWRRWPCGSGGLCARAWRECTGRDKVVGV